MTMHSMVLAAALGLLGATSLSAQAAFEDITEDNSSVLTAQDLGALSAGSAINLFGLRGDVEVFGTLLSDNSDPDFYAFTIGADQVVTITVSAPEGPTELNDPFVGLFDDDGFLLAFDDDSGPGFDSLLVFTLSEAGQYIVGVSGYRDLDFDGLDDFDLDATPSTNWPYHLQVSVQPVPLPAAGWLLGSALIGLALRRRRA
jgi:hypothetical protein